ncbi:hypothetical protein F2Q68_00004952 [Brassica cretica]|uniref:Uncharacterized protein n=1 Tax=Brassica cretica TaxID=69181 RepID=A0A8S9JGJ3_BRACR|nr:hypothetical protein F2Q68_00004952 [Brassica cretica]
MDHEKTKSRSGNRPRDLVRLNNMKRASWTSDETAGRCENEARSAGRSSDKLSVAHIKFGQLRSSWNVPDYIKEVKIMPPDRITRKGKKRVRS